MTDEARRRPQAPPAGPKSVRLVPLPPAAMIALLDGDLSTASVAAKVDLTRYFTSDEMMWLWRLRIDRLACDPVSGRWGPHAAVAEPDGIVVGHAGFHGAPDAQGTVEIGYSVDPAYRRRGYAKAMVGALLRHATAEPTVQTVRASISRGNSASLATVARCGFTQVKEEPIQHDDFEVIFEAPAR
jgi:ribosomal-protein-alanine N-acetyltransferase